MFTTLNIYSHITDTMQRQAAIRIDREIGGTDAQMPEFTQSVEPPKGSEQVQSNATPEPKFEPYKGKIRKPGTGCVTMINDHLYEGRFSPRVNGKRISKNVYAKTREECEEKLAELIKTMKAEIAEMKKTSEERITHRGATTYFGIAEMGRPSKFASVETNKSQIG